MDKNSLAHTRWECKSHLLRDKEEVTFLSFVSTANKISESAKFLADNSHTTP